MQLQLIAADAPKFTDWLTAIAATVGVCVTAGVGIAVAIYTAGYRMRILALCDPDGKVIVGACNSGRVRGEVDSVEFVVHASWGVRLIRKLRGKNELEPILAAATPDGRQIIEPGQTCEWRIDVPDPNKERTLPPTLRHPLRDGPKGQVKPRQLMLRIGLGVYRRPRYLRYHRFIPFRRIGQLGHRLALPNRSAPSADDAVRPAVSTLAQDTRPAVPPSRLAVAAAAVGFAVGAFARYVIPSRGRSRCGFRVRHRRK